MDIEALKTELKRDEGVELKPYTDTVGKLTIGVGRNLDDVGITISEADFLLGDDIERVTAELNRTVPWWSELPEGPSRALANMCFNMGWPRLSGFKKMLAALERGDYETAAKEALDSQWAGQVGNRAQRIAAQIREGAGANSVGV